MGAAVTFVMTIATIVTYLLQTYLLMPMKLDYMQTIVFILVIAALVQLLEIIIKKIAPSLYQALGVFLPLAAMSAIGVPCMALGIWDKLICSRIPAKITKANVNILLSI